MFKLLAMPGLCLFLAACGANATQTGKAIEAESENIGSQIEQGLSQTGQAVQKGANEAQGWLENRK